MDIIPVRQAYQEGVKMPHIVVNLWPGRSEENKRDIAVKLRDYLSEEMKLDKKWFSVQVHDVPQADWQSEIVEKTPEKELFVKADF